MSEIVGLTLDYFRPPKGYFWRWAEKGDVLEWKDGFTICYREELMFILRGLSPNKIPPLGALLLVLAACQENWKTSSNKIGDLILTLRTIKYKHSGQSHEMLEDNIRHAAKFLHLINELPHESRSSVKKIHLIHEIFERLDNQYSLNDSNRIIQEFGSGRLDELLISEGEELSEKRFKEDFELFDQALKQFLNKNSLELKLKTGIEALPQAARIEIPEPPLDLLDELAKDTKTAGISRLTRRLIAALNISMHAQGKSDQPFGGVSDITNRGNFDKLLLSELANDDALLMARLVNNEALYLRREEPPDKVKRQRIILIDSTIKMWGLPRVFAISAALACAQDQKQRADISAFTLGKTDSVGIDLSTKSGIIDALEYLDAGLNCGAALTAFMKDQAMSHATDYILISNAESYHDHNFQLAINELKQALNFFITVDREGNLQFHEFNKGKGKLLNSAKFDLDDLLFTPSTSSKLNRVTDNLPVFLYYKPAPLYFPTTGINPSSKESFFDPNFGLVGITESRRVLYWPSKDLGAIELLNTIEKGNYIIGKDATSSIFLMVSNPKDRFLKFYKIRPDEGVIESIDLSKEVTNVVEVRFKEGFFYIQTNITILVFDCTASKIIEDNTPVHSNLIFKQHPKDQLLNRLASIKNHIYNGYSVLQKITKIYISKGGLLSLDGHQLQLLNDSIKISERRNEDGKENSFLQENPEISSMLPNISIKFRKFTWADGSEAVVDSRGMLHLRSSDKSIPEITIVLIIGKTSAAWASDGTHCGSSYFTGSSSMIKKTPTDFFYKNYIQRFIDRLN